MTWADDHAAGLHQAEVVAIIKKLEPQLEGHSRAIIVIALQRIIAAMLLQANKATQDALLEGLPVTTRAVMDEMKRLKKLRRQI